MLFLLPNQQCQSTKEALCDITGKKSLNTKISEHRVSCTYLAGIFATYSDALKVRNQLVFTHAICQICRT